MRLTLDSATLVAALLVCFAGFIAVIVRMAVVQTRFVRRLRTRHADVWSELRKPADSPSGAPEAGSKAPARVTFYMYFRGFRTLGDPVTRDLGERAWRAHAIFIGYTVVATVLVLALVGFAK